jgi:PAS domain S-box-containing protein
VIASHDPPDPTIFNNDPANSPSVLIPELPRPSNELAKLATLSRALISTIDLEQLLGNVADDIIHVVGMTRCCLYMFDHSRRIYAPRVWRGYPDSIARNPIREHEGVIGDVGSERQMLYYSGADKSGTDPELDRRDRLRHGYARSLGARSFVAVPILNGKNDCLGVVVADTRGRSHEIEHDTRHLLSAFITQAGIAVENALLYVRSQEDFNKIRRLTEYTENVLLSIPAGIISTDANGKILRWNRAAELALHQTAGFLRGHLLSTVLRRICVPDQERVQILEHFQQVLETGESVYQYKLSPRVGSDSRSQKTLSVNLSRLTYHGEAHGVVLSLEDVTQEVMLVAQLERIRRLADIGQLAAKMAHEVRNALSPIRGAAQIIRSELEAQRAPTEWPDIIIAEVDGLSRLTSTMLDFARPVPLDVRVLSPVDFITGCITSLASFLDEHSVRVDWEIAPELPEVIADPVQLGQAVRNVVMNAAQSMPNGGELAIELANDQTNQGITIRFRDSGGGIAPEQRDSIFQPFVTTKPKGTGLGLSIVQKIVSLHGGRVDVESSPGKGACFILSLPLKPPTQPVETSAESPPLISSQSGRFPDN